MNTPTRLNPGFIFDPAQYPETPGCFLIKDADGKVLYISGTVNLRKRLAEIFSAAQQPGGPRAPGSRHEDDRLPRLASRVSAIELILLSRAVDGAALVNTLIARYHPAYNFATYYEPSGSSYILCIREPFPRLIAASGKRAEKALEHGEPGVWGPFPTGAVRDLLLKCVVETFGLRTCDPMPRKACVSYQLKLCSGPCEGWISAGEYADRLAQAARYLAEPGQGLEGILQSQMQAATEALEFERAGRIRDQIQALRTYLGRRPEHPVTHNQDVISIGQGQALILHLRRGVLVDLELQDAEGDLSTFLNRRYAHECPPELILSGEPGLTSDLDALASSLSAANGRPVTLSQPQSGYSSELAEVARANLAWRLNALNQQK